MELLDRQTAETLERLTSAGLIRPTHRAIRGLLAGESGAAVCRPLSEEERRQVGECRALAARKWKRASLLAGGGLAEEARQAARESLLAEGRALAIEQRFPEPKEIQQLLYPPWAIGWKENLPLVKRFLEDHSAATDLLNSVLGKSNP